MKTRIIISGGGTGGHIFPAISIADMLKTIEPDCEILFVGAQDRMEMERVPQAGYKILGLPVAGINRSMSMKNLSMPFKLAKSLSMAKKIIKNFHPDVVVGVGGYASAPVLFAAESMGIPCLIQEQNSFAGVTNKLVGKKAKKICVAYDNMEKFFPADKIKFTGNPIRKGIVKPTKSMKRDGIEFYNLDPSKKTIFVVGGSLGARRLNQAVMEWIKRGGNSSVQLLWQSGKGYKTDIDAFMLEHKPENVLNLDFIQRMDLAYAAADVVISRAGAGTISELSVVGKPVIFVPSPHVAEDHQTHNAMALVSKGAAMMIKDDEAVEKMMDAAIELAFDNKKLEAMEEAIVKLGIDNASEVIAKEILKLKNV
ncbi:MAG: undecaprenyldiphospho-muramoylpentapeptide beta-N-acetylglucosaminyltransferase [Bacteroidales bacterium]|nr:undecaprenyldiphospho-muramoylpentapeptide beta-N-acetylglucosaminyltransferase [Bacteroidales bacterium]